MNWSKIKTALIVMFSLINVFLIIWNLVLRHERSVVDVKTIEYAESLLYDRGITIPKGMIDEAIPDIKMIVVKNVMANEAEFLGAVLGTNYEKDESVFRKGKRSVSTEGNSFTIEDEQSIKSAEEAKSWLSSMGFDMNGTLTAEKNGVYEFRSVYRNMEIFGSKISVKTEGEKATAYGSFFYVTENSEKDVDIRHITSVLPKLIKEGITDCEVSSVKTGYMVVTEGEKFSESNANPAYKILLSNGKEFFYNATK